jgi:hypothetical protein
MKSRHFHWIVLLSCATMGLSVRCGAPAAQKETTSTASTQPESRPTADVCGLLTAAEIEKVLGSAPGESQPGTDGLGECTWPSAGASSPLLTLKLSSTDLDSYEAFVHSYQTEFGGEEPSAEYYHRVQDLGTWAMYVVDDGALRIYQGDRRLDVAPQPRDEEKAVALGRMAAGRLK